MNQMPDISDDERSRMERACAFRDQYRRERVMREAGEIVREAFSSATSPGTLRMRESPYYREPLQLDGFLSALKELFP